MVIRRSHFISICLLALASSIALTEYLTYTPTIVPDSVDDDLFSNGEAELTEKDINVDETTEATANADHQKEQSEAQEADQPIITSQPPADTKQTEIPMGTANTPFSNSEEHTAVITNGSTITTILTKLGFDKTDIHNLSKALSKVFNLKNLKIGQEVIIKGKKDKDNKLVLKGLEVKTDPRFKVTVSRNDSGAFIAEKVNVPLKKVMRSVSGCISPKSPALSLKQCGVKQQIASEALRALGNVVDIKASKHSLDFEFLYKDLYDEDGNTVGKPEPVYFSVINGGKIHRIYRFNRNGATQYVDSNGTILNTAAKSRSSLIQPVGYTKINSAFGIRRHPISGRIKMHTGIDLAAHVGTPVKAASSGVVTRASNYAAYGKYINIAHSREISTAYGHLSRIIVRSGQRVTQGQIIGYSGNSGVSSGPHVHYEVIKGGRFVNPLAFVSVKQEPMKLSGKDLASFYQFKKEVNLQVVGLSQSSSKKKSVGKLRKYS